MSEFDDYYEEMTVAWLKAHDGTAVTYTGADGTATSATAILGEETVEEIPTEEGRQQRRVREVTVFKDEVAAVNLKGSLTIAGERWAIEEILGSTPGDALLRCVRTEPVEISRPDYRKGR